MSENEKRVLKVHEDFNHRKTIESQVKEIGLEISGSKLREILGKCLVCKRKDTTRKNPGKHVETKGKGEVIAADVMQVNEKEKIVLAIDYFTRMIYGAVILTKESRKILRFLQGVHKELKIEKLITDSGKEFDNKSIREWTKGAGIEHELVTPYYHQGNGRIERANRTIRDALRKSKGLLRVNLKRIINRYNETEHRALGMSPKEAMKGENREGLLERQEKYKNEFKEKKLRKYEIGSKVLIKNEQKKDKMDDEFRESGEIRKALNHDAYEVLLEDGSMLRRHSSQLRNR